MDINAIRAQITKDACMHTVAARIILETRKNTKFYRPMATAKLAFVYQVPFKDALAVISEMDVQDPPPVVY